VAKYYRNGSRDGTEGFVKILGVERCCRLGGKGRSLLFFICEASSVLAMKG
jgi:hypothetical protein